MTVHVAKGLEFPYVFVVSLNDGVFPSQRTMDEDGEDGIYGSAEIQVESDKANYNADIGFVCRRDGVVPPGTGEGKKQVWTGYKEGD